MNEGCIVSTPKQVYWGWAGLAENGRVSLTQRPKGKGWEFAGSAHGQSPRSGLKRGICGKSGAIQELVDGPSIKYIQSLTSHPASTIWNGTSMMTG
jgi:hypothetical protein